jgi:hypothetical protein
MKRRIWMPATVVAGTLTLAIAGCGGGGSDDPGKVAVKVTENGKGSASIEIPAKIEGGAVEMTLDNSSNKAPHDAQLVRLTDGHSYEEASSILNSNRPQEIPDWIQAYGGIGQTNPGETGTATVKLDEGHYVALDDVQGGPQSPHTEFDVSGENDADLPDADATVTAATTDSSDPAHEYEWQTDGLKAGDNTITFDSQGKEALHLIVAAPIKEGATIDDVAKDLESNGPPRSVDIEKSTQTAILDGDKQDVTHLKLEAGRYAFICFLPDRDEPDKPHFKQGLLKEVTIPQG